MSKETCGNCGTPTDNEPMVLCDYCGDEGAISDAAIRSELESARALVAELAEAVANHYPLTHCGWSQGSDAHHAHVYEVIRAALAKTRAK